MTYRTDIQGLRAVCVMIVVFYHAKLPGFSGGFIGVDVFFVLSGFLITNLLLAELQKTRSIDVIAFWARRIRRLLPNALLVLLFTFLAATAIGQSRFGSGLSHDLAAASLNLANYHFAYRATDYFNTDAATSPVLHYWSLAVEEQYYLMFPVALWLGQRFFSKRPGLHCGLFLGIVVIASFAISLHYIARSQPDAFFRTEARLWQIAAGGVAASFFSRLDVFPSWLRSAVAWLGLAALAFACTQLDDTWKYPGYLALLPVAATLALIAGGNAQPTAPVWALGSKPLQLVGDASYSIYLWHFPVMVLFETLAPDVPHIRLLALGVSMPLAMTAYQFVEKPIRTGARLRRGTAIAVAISSSVGAAAAFVVLGSWLSTDARSPERARLIAAAQRDVADLGPCQLTLRDSKLEPCVYAAKGAAKRVVLFGDSYAGHLFDSVRDAAVETGWQLKVRVKLSCPPLDAFAYSLELKAPDTACMTWRQSVVNELIQEKPDLLIISSWAGFTRTMHDPRTEKPLSRQASEDAWRTGFRQMMKQISDAGIRIVVVRSTPSARPRVLDCLVSEAADSCNRPRNDAMKSGELALEVARELPYVGIVDLTDRFCSTNTCYSVIKGVIVYRDNSGHLTASFARSLASNFATVLNASN